MGLDHAIGIDTFRSLRDTEQHAPSWATFRAAYDNTAKQRRHLAPALPEAPVDEPDKARLDAILQRARAALTKPI